MDKEKFIYEVRENVYRIKIIRERPKIRIDEYIYGNIQNAIERRNEDKSDYEVIANHYEELNNQYDKIMEYSSSFIDVITINTYEENIEQVRNHVKKLVRKWLIYVM